MGGACGRADGGSTEKKRTALREEASAVVGRNNIIRGEVGTEGSAVAGLFVGLRGDRLLLGTAWGVVLSVCRGECKLISEKLRERVGERGVSS